MCWYTHTNTRESVENKKPLVEYFRSMIVFGAREKSKRTSKPESKNLETMPIEIIACKLFAQKHYANKNAPIPRIDNNSSTVTSKFI